MWRRRLNASGLLFLCFSLPGLIQLPSRWGGRIATVDGASCPPIESFYAQHCECFSTQHGNNCHQGSIVSAEETLLLECTQLPGFAYNEQNVTETVTCLVITESPDIVVNKTNMGLFPRLTGLHIKDSALSSIAYDAFEDTPRLQYLVLRNNRLSVIPSLDTLTKLIRLDVSRNQILSMPAETFINNNELQTVLAEFNSITSITGSVFANKCNLAHIDLSHNLELTVVEDRAFEGTPVDILDISYTRISRVPVTDSLRSRLQELFLEGTNELKTFDAYMPGPAYFNQTFPRLRTVKFAYHAHCCQLKTGRNGVPHHYYDASSVARRVRSLLQRIGSYLFGRKRVVRQIPTVQMYTCVNLSSSQCVEDLSSLNMTDSSTVTFLSRDELCNGSEDVCVGCLQGICGNNCVNISSPEVTSNFSTPVICVPSNQSVSPTASISPTRTVSTQMVSPSIVSSTAVVSPSIVSSTAVVSPSIVSSTAVVSPSIVSSTAVAIAMSSASPVSTPNCFNEAPSISTTLELNRCTATPQPTPTAITTTEPPISSFCVLCRNDNCDPPFCDYECDFCSKKKKRSPIDSFDDDFEMKRSRRNADCIEEVSALCVNCSLNTSLPQGWFQLDSSSELICTEQNVTPTATTVISTTSPPTTVTNTPGTVVQEACDILDISRFVQTNVTTCFPVPDAFNPCSNLLNEENYLRVAIWFVIILAFIGNVLVIFVFIFYTCVIRRSKMEYFIMHFFYFNMALADFLMCLYLLTIASEDLHTLNRFSEDDIIWRTGHGCKFAGFTAILSTVVSVYVLTVITLERAYTILNAMHRKTVSKKVAYLLMAIGWALGFLIAVLPVTGHVSDYGFVAICLPFRVESDLDKSYVVFLLLATGVAFLTIAVTYVIIFCHIFCRRSLSRASSSRRTTEIKVAIRMFILVFTNFICWFPIALVSLASVFGEGIVQDIEFAKWAVVFIFPINSCLNPILYSLSTKVFRENFIIVLSKARLCRQTAMKITRERAGITPSGTSQRSDAPSSSRPTIIDRLRLLSISSQGSLLNSRRDSSLSQLSDAEHYKISLIHNRRRSSALSDSSNEDTLYNRNGIRRGSSGTSIEETNISIIPNPNFRSSSPESNKGSRMGTKVSVSSLSTLPEEGEPVVPTVDANMIKLNPAYIEEDQENVSKENEETTDISRNELIITNSDAVNCPQHQILSNVLEENGSGHSENFSGSPSLDELSEVPKTECIHEEFEFD